MRNPVKKEVTRYRRQMKRYKPFEIPLIHILINVRSHLQIQDFGRSELVRLFEICNTKSLHREYGIKGLVIDAHGGKCFRQVHFRPEYGHKTIVENGKVYSENPYQIELPF